MRIYIESCIAPSLRKHIGESTDRTFVCFHCEKCLLLYRVKTEICEQTAVCLNCECHMESSLFKLLVLSTARQETQIPFIFLIDLGVLPTENSLSEIFVDYWRMYDMIRFSTLPESTGSFVTVLHPQVIIWMNSWKQYTNLEINCTCLHKRLCIVSGYGKHNELETRELAWKQAKKRKRHTKIVPLVGT